MTHALCSLDRFGLLAFSGADARAFLHGQLSCDVAGLPLDTFTFGSYSTPKGRMLATFRLWAQDESLFMQVPRDVCEAVRKRLQIFILRAKVNAEDVSSHYRLFGSVVDSLPAPAAIACPAQTGHLTTQASGTALRVSAARVQWVVPAAHAAQNSAGHVIAADDAAWRLADIRDGIPWIVPATQELFVPQAANLDLIGGISFSKGCYPGQEIVARMHYLGRLKERMIHARIDGDPPAAGGKLRSATFGAQAAGVVVDAAPCPDGGSELLAVAQTAAVTANDLMLDSATAQPLALLSLPYTAQAAA